MKKIPSLFARNHDTNGLLRNEVTPGCEWVIAGEGVATRKYDGACWMIRAGVLYKRRTLREGEQSPAAFEPVTAFDPVTHTRYGWMPLSTESPEDQYFREALEAATQLLPDGTYELCGPMIQCNRERFTSHVLVPHGKDILEDCPRDFHRLRDYLCNRDIEGIVWHHHDGRMAKIKGSDFGRRNARPGKPRRF
ncbi:RNA ligase 1 family protein [Tuwongella immobilis]|uniref:RNA ligase domain-containing protein n=1 Tax=Tuwongella immobilis TaxID=692036 RepID=A0A6C2YHZ7_9BACT|nr:DUF5565 family protein [Tuwongella immobilis]VIP00763.1 Uncharacterized protein OS=Pirellula staleyi (strain ATCC 27377 / DSM 6068 / ICPB 4128) GN=Psta_0587 PE=4 SV=1 [Tuwongella immobilis]VTR96944.1 Uncharacterized protein OS=Pirellula staleyi (strain ATCC 27377 / DSM 6068 / ICPB 4128) GN=Psta_0587 PE=4 SV=1 [Tuwongella immobilis]